MATDEGELVPSAGMSRREVLRYMGIGGAALALAPGALMSRATGPGLTRFVTPSSIKNNPVVWTNIALPANLDPAIGFDSDTLQMVRNVYEGLLEYVPGGTMVRAALATSHSASADGLTWTFQIRPGVVFHDGTPLDAAAVVTSLNRIKSINQRPASLLTNVKSFSAVGSSTVLVHMSAPYVFLPGVTPWLPIVSPAALAAHKTSADPWAEKWFASNAAGTGPYMLTSFTPSTRVEMTMNTHYWQPWKNGTPTSGTMTLTPDVSTQLELLQAGEVQFLGDVSPTDAATAKTLSNVVVLTGPGLEVQEMPLNISKPPMNDIRVRRAIIKTFDYNAFLLFSKGFDKLANSPTPAGLPGWDASIPYAVQDLPGAKKLLAEAGVAPGTTLSFVGVGGVDYEAFAATVLQSALAKIGIKLTITAPPWPVPFTEMAKPSTAAHISFLNLSANTNDPSATLHEAFQSSQIASKGGYNWSYYQNPVVDADLLKFGQTVGAAAQNALIAKIQQTIVNDAASVYVAYPELLEPVTRQWRNSKYDALYDMNVVRWFYCQEVAR